MYKRMTPNVMVEDVVQTVAFYRDILGLEFVMAVPANSQTVMMECDDTVPLVYALMKHNDINIMFQAQQSLATDIPAFAGMAIGGTVSFYFELDDVDACYETVRQKAEIVKDIETTWYGMREFYIRDCNGYIIGFAQQT